MQVHARAAGKQLRVNHAAQPDAEGGQPGCEHVRVGNQRYVAGQLRGVILHICIN
jgi:hypothetical protein